jgi:dTDP-4-amino-4,6-dideoxygalactose transaminase
MQLAARGGEKVYHEPVGVWPRLSAVAQSAAQITPSSKADFEAAFAAYLGASHAIAVNSGTTALDVLARRRSGPVISSCFSHPASVQFAVRNRAVEYVDIDPETLCMSVPGLRRSLETTRPCAVIVTHVGGAMRDMPDIARLCAEAEVPLIEDASHAHGSAMDGVSAGTFGDIGCFSLHASKNLPAGEGGVLVTNSEDLFLEAWRLHDLGRAPGATPYAFSGFGGNFRIHPAGAALALAGLPALDADEVQRCRTVDHVVAELPRGIAALGADRRRTESKRSYHFLPLVYASEHFGGASRKRMVMMLSAEGITCSEGWTFLLPELERDRSGDVAAQYPQADDLRKKMIWLDHRMLLQESAGEATVEALWKIQTLLS